MELINYTFITAFIISTIGNIILLLWHLRHHNSKSEKAHKIVTEKDNLLKSEQEKLQIEMRDKARKELERVVGENAAFIQEDVRRNTSELNGYMQQEVARTIEDELKKFKDSAAQVNKATLDSIAKAQTDIAQQYAKLNEQLAQQVNAEKERLITQFQDNMADVVGHYIVAAVGDKINVDDQLGHILSELTQNKQAIAKDIGNGL